MWAPVVVKAQIGNQRRCASSRREEYVAIGPFAQQRLNKAFRFAVRPGRVGPCEAMPDRPGPTDACEAARPIAAAIVGEEAPDRDPAAPKPPERIPQKRRAGAPPLGSAHFDEGDAGRIVNRDVDVLIADAPGA